MKKQATINEPKTTLPPRPEDMTPEQRYQRYWDRLRSMPWGRVRELHKKKQSDN